VSYRSSHAATQAAAVVVAEVRPVVLQRAVPHGDDHGRRELHVVLLAGEVALQLGEDLAPPGGVDRAALAHEEIGHHRVVDVALVLQLLRVVHAVHVVVGVDEGRLRAVGQRVELAEVAARDEGAVFPLVERRRDPDVLQVLEEELDGVHERRGAVAGEAEARGQSRSDSRRR
jgi:hypothetical protein